MMDEYRKATDSLPVEQAVYVEIAESPERRAAEAGFLLDLMNSGKSLISAAVIGGNPADADFAAYVQRFQSAPDQRRALLLSQRRG